jgi:hypothetical protein
LDPTGSDALLRGLAWGHPLWMAISLCVVALALRAGLGLRRARLRRAPRSRAELDRHARLGKLAVILVVVGFAGGPLSMALLRGREPFGTAHALAGVCAALLFAAAGLLGRRLERARGRPLRAHAALALAATLAAAAAFATGFVLLP